MNRGFVAITSALSLSAVLMVLMLLSSTASWYVRADRLEFSNKKVSESLAEGCVRVALLRVAQQYAYVPVPGGEVVVSGSYSCTIASVTYGAENATHAKEVTIDVLATYQHTRTHLIVVVLAKNPAFATSTPTVVVRSWSEQP